LKEKVIEPYKGDSFHTNALLVSPKKDGWRICLDLRYINTLIPEESSNFIPQIDEIFGSILKKKCKYFTTLDLKSAYHKMKIRMQDRWTTCFKFENKVYNFIGCPFGVKTFPNIFCKMMQETLAGFEEFTLFYLDDIVIFSESLDEHVDHVSKVIQRLNDVNLTLKPSKCRFANESIQLLGHIISNGSLSIDASKLEDCHKWKRPTTPKAVQRFCGVANYFRRYFLAEKYLKPFHELKNKRKFTWNAELEENYCKIIDELHKLRTLYFPDYKFPLKLATDRLLAVAYFRMFQLKRKMIL
jgi:hypothetical protein